MERQTASAGNEDRQFVSALARGLSVLRCFDRPKIELTTAEIARRTGLSQPTVWRLCYTLIECGFLVRAPGGAGLRIGAPALTLGYAAARGLDAPALALPYMQRLLDQTGGSTTLSVRQGAEMVAVEQLNGDFVVRDQPVGWRAPIDTVSAGLAVLAALPPPAREAAISAIDYRDAARRERHRTRIDDAVAALARDGAVRLGNILDGRYTAVAVPLFETGSEPSVQWALTCGGLAASWTGQDLDMAAAVLVETRALLAPAFAALGG